MILSNHWDLLGASDTTRCLYDAGFKIGSRRNRRLQDILVHSSIPLPHKRGKKGKRINECPKTTCIYCDSMDKTGHIYSYMTKQSYESKFNICCQSSNLVYCLQCNTCGKQYVGQTKRKSNDFRNILTKSEKKSTKTTPLVVISTPLDTQVISNKLQPTYLLSSHYPAIQMAHSICASNLKDTGSQALTTPRKIRLPIGQPAGKNQVTPSRFRLPPFTKPSKQYSIWGSYDP